MLIRVLRLSLLPALLLSTIAEGTAESINDGQPRSDNRAARSREYLRAYSDQMGRVRPDLWLQGIQQAARLPRAREAAMAAPAINALGAWTQIGPQPLRIEDDAIGHVTRIFQGVGPDSGEVMDIAIDPRGAGGPDRVAYIATNNGGIWKSTDGGQTWLPKADQLLSLSMGAVALDPRRPDIVYAGTGNPFDSGALTIDSPFGPAPRFTKGVGVYKSLDGGETWTRLNPFNKGIFNNVAINRILVPATPPGSAVDLVLIATSNGLYRSLDGGRNVGNDDFALNLKPVLTGYISDVRADSASPYTIYVAQHGGGIFRSNDGGRTFPTNLFAGRGAPPAGTFGFISFAQSSLPDGQTMYASVANAARPFPNGATWNGLYRSADRGATWTAMRAALATGGTPGNDTGGVFPPNACLCGFDQTIGVDPQNPRRVYLGFQELYASTDSGATFTKVSRGNPAPAGTHWDHHALVFSPRTHWSTGNPIRLWTGTDGGIHSSSDGGTTWTNLNETIATNLIVQLDMGRGSPSNRQYTYAGTWDTGTVQRRPEANETNPLAWQSAADGDGGGVAVNPTNPANAYGLWGGRAISTQDGGKVWAYMRQPDGGLMCAWRHALDDSGQTLFTTSSEIVANPDPLRRDCNANPGSFVYRKLPGRDVETIGDFSALGVSIESIGMDRVNPSRVWVGLSDGMLARSDNARHNDPAKVAWRTTILMQDTNGKNVPHLSTPVGGIALDPNDPNQVVAVYLGFCGTPCTSKSTQHVFLGTTDATTGNTTWQDITGDLPDLPTRSVVIDPNSPASIIVSNDAGVYYTTNRGASWAQLGTGLPRTTASQLAIDHSVTPSVIRIGTYGRSAFELR